MKILRWIMKSFTDPNLYKSLAYLFLTFPLGILYFVALVTGFSMGAGLLIVGVGLLILALLLIGVRFAGWFELLLARYLLNAEVDLSLGVNYDSDESFWTNARTALTDGRTVRSLIFLGLKFPLGIMTFVLTVVSIVVPLAMIIAPLAYNDPEYGMTIGSMQVDTLAEAIPISILGLILLPLSLLMLRGVARGWKSLAENLLNPRENEEKAKNKQKRKLKNSELIEDYEFYDEEDEWEDEVVSLGALVNDTEGVYRRQ